jgi:hypothetical protein
VRQQLALRNARLVREAETLMHEFERITVLPGERWATTLQRLQGTGEAKLASARGEYERLLRATPGANGGDEARARRPSGAARRADRRPPSTSGSPTRGKRGARRRAERCRRRPTLRCERAFVPLLRSSLHSCWCRRTTLLSDEGAAWQPVRDALRLARGSAGRACTSSATSSPTLAAMRQLVVAMPGIEQFGGGGGGGAAE